MKPLQRHAAAGSFYHLAGMPLTGCACNGLACFAARADNPERWAKACQQSSPVYCLGKCYTAPSDADHDTSLHIAVHSRRSVLLDNVSTGGVRGLAEYQKRSGGTARLAALSMPPADVVRLIDIARLRGRGGAGFLAGRKWQAMAARHAHRKYLVINADEGDPGAFSDRFLLEGDPFRLIEAAIIAAHATGATHGYIYLRKEYPDAARVLANALLEARAAGWLGAQFDLECVIGEGSYLCGEETALLNALEGRRPEARMRPPQLTEHGLFGLPTLVQNVETLCAVPWIVTHGADAFAGLGFSQSRGTKLLSLNSLFRKPGVYEVEFGIPLERVVDELGGGLRRGQLKGVMVGGPLAGIVPPALLGTPLGYEEMQAIGCAVGHGGVIAFADDTPLAAIVEEVFRFGARESCGKCTPCHLGTPRLAAMFAAVGEGGARRGGEDAAQCDALLEALAATSLCGHGRGLAEFARAVQTHYVEEWSACFG